jgi:type IV secretion system protein VirB10
MRGNNGDGNGRRLAHGGFPGGGSADGEYGGLPFDGSDSGDEPDANRQAQKQAFLQQTRRSSYLKNALTPPVSPYEIKTGTVIPSVLISELSSDLPGEIVAQVAQNVYDTASGNHLLIPQGTKLFGVYDSGVTVGQNRLLVSWHRLIYPNAATLELDGMAGNDAQGKAGLRDRVNNHYARIFGTGLLLSVISAGYQLSQPQQQSTFNPLSDQQVAAAAVGQQLSQLGTEVARRNLRIQPTIEIRKGYRMNVMVNKDIVFPGSYQP